MCDTTGSSWQDEVLSWRPLPLPPPLPPPLPAASRRSLLVRELGGFAATTLLLTPRYLPLARGGYSAGKRAHASPSALHPDRLLLRIAPLYLFLSYWQFLTRNPPTQHTTQYPLHGQNRYIHPSPRALLRRGVFARFGNSTHITDCFIFQTAPT